MDDELNAVLTGLQEGDVIGMVKGLVFHLLRAMRGRLSDYRMTDLASYDFSPSMPPALLCEGLWLIDGLSFTGDLKFACYMSSFLVDAYHFFCLLMSALVEHALRVNHASDTATCDLAALPISLVSQPGLIGSAIDASQGARSLLRCTVFATPESQTLVFRVQWLPPQFAGQPNTGGGWTHLVIDIPCDVVCPDTVPHADVRVVGFRGEPVMMLPLQTPCVEQKHRRHQHPCGLALQSWWETQLERHKMTWPDVPDPTFAQPGQYEAMPRGDFLDDDDGQDATGGVLQELQDGEDISRAITNHQRELQAWIGQTGRETAFLNDIQRAIDSYTAGLGQ
jgi:hypothetical protein